MIERLKKAIQGRWAKGGKSASMREEKRREMRFEPLEERILLSADAALLPQAIHVDAGPALVPETVIVADNIHVSDTAAAVHDSPDIQTAENQAQPPADPSAAQTGRQLVIVDPSLPDYQELIQTIPDNEKEDLFVLDAHRDGIDQITDILAKYQDVGAVHILSHGAQGALNLGDGFVDVDGLEANSAQVQGWQASLAPGADILLYGCEVGQGETGMAFLQTLSRMTGADVAASIDDTGGDTEQGANWNLEASIGSIQTPQLFADAENPDYDHRLDFFPVAATAGADAVVIDLYQNEILVNGIQINTFDNEDNTFTVNGLDGSDSLEIRGANTEDTIAVSAGQIIVVSESGSDTITSTINFSNFEGLTVTGNNDTDSITVTTDLSFSGGINLAAETITVQPGLTLWAGSGNLTLTADDRLDNAITLTPFLDITSTHAEINIMDGVTLMGGQVAVTAYADSKHAFFDDNAGGEATLDFISAISLVGGVASSTATARVTVGDNSHIAGDDVAICAQALSEATVDTSAIFLGVSVGLSKPIAEVTVGDARIDAADTLTMDAMADGKVKVKAVSNFMGLVNTGEFADVTVAVGTLEGNATVQTGAQSQVTAGNTADVGAEFRKDVNVRASSTTNEEGMAGVAVAVSYSRTRAETLISGELTAGNDVTLSAENQMPYDEGAHNDTAANAGVGYGVLGRAFKGLKDKVGVGKLENYLAGKMKPLDPGSGGPRTVAFSGGIAVADQEDSARTVIQPQALVSSREGDVNVTAEVVDMPEISSSTTVDSTPAGNDPNASQKKNSGALALVIGNYDHISEAVVGAGSQVDAGGDLNLKAETRLPYEIQWHQFGQATDTDDNFSLSRLGDGIIDKLNTNFGIQDGFFTSWAKANATGTENTAAASINLLNLNNTSRTVIGENARINTARQIADLEATGNQLSFTQDHHFIDGQAVVYTAQAGAVIDGLVNGATYYVDVVDNRHIRLAATFADATANTDPADNLLAITLTGTLQAGSIHHLSAVHGQVNLSARNEIDAVHFAGQPFPLLNTSQSGGAGGGGAWLDIGYTDIVEAQIKSGAQVVAEALSVRADNDTRNIAISATHGVADGAFGINGSVSVLTMDNRTIAGIDDGAIIETGSALVEIPRQFDFVSGNADMAFSLQSSFDPATVVDDADSTLLEFPSDHGLNTGDAVIYRNGGGTDIGGLTDGEIYYVIQVDANSIKFAHTPVEATSGMAIILNKSLAQGAAHRLDRTFDPTRSGAVDTGQDTIDLGYTHGLTTGEAVVYSTNGSTEIGGLEDGHIYYAVVVNPTTLKLVSTNAEALLSNPVGINLTSTGDGNFHMLAPAVYTPGFSGYYVENESAGLGDSIIATTAATLQTDMNVLVSATDDAEIYNIGGGFTKGRTAGVGATVARNLIDRDTKAFIGNETLSLGLDGLAPGVGVDDAADTIDLGYAHGFQTGDAVVYDSGGGAEIGGLSDGATYYVIRDGANPNLLKLAATAGDAQAPERGFDPGAVDPLLNRIHIEAHGLTDGQAVVYRGSGTDIDGLESGTTYYVIVDGPDDIRLAPTLAVANTAAFDADTDVDLQENTIAMTAHGLDDGQAVVYRAQGGDEIDGLTDGQTYYAVVVDDDHIQLAESSDLETVVNLQTAGSGSQVLDTAVHLDAATASPGTHLLDLALNLDPAQAQGAGHSLARTFNPATAVNSDLDTIQTGYAHGFVTGQAVVYTNGGGESIGGLTDGEIYYAIRVDDVTLQLAESYAEALNGKGIDLATSAATGSAHGIGAAFHATPQVDGSQDLFKLETPHGLNTGEALVYHNGGGTSIGGLVDGQTYYVVKIDAVSFKLAQTQADALAAVPLTVDLDPSVATGSAHSLSTPVSDTGLVDAGGKTKVFADNVGSIFNISIAGSSVSEKETAKKSLYKEGARPADKPAPKYGIGISGSVAVNDIRDLTQAFIADGHVTSPAEVSLEAHDQTDIFALTGAAAFAFSKAPKTAGIAGAVSINTIDGDTHAFISHGDVAAGGGLALTADTQGEILAISASIAGVPKKQGLGIAGQVGINTIRNDTLAFIGNGSVIRTSTLSATARTASEIISVAGAVEYGGKAGFGASVAVNRISGGTRAFIAGADSQGVVVDGDIVLDARNDSDITAVSAALGISPQGFAAAFSVGVNIISPDTLAYITDSSSAAAVTAGGDLLISAMDDADIFAFTGGGTYSESVGIGVSFSYNNIDSQARAFIENAAVDAQGDIRLVSQVLPPAIVVDGATDTVDYGIAHNLQTGAAVVYDESTWETVDGLTDGQTYYAVRVDDTHIKLAETAALAMMAAGADSKKTFNESQVNAAFDMLTITGHGLTNGQAVIYRRNGLAPISGLIDNQTYYVIVVDADHIQLSATPPGSAVDIAPPAAGANDPSATYALETGILNLEPAYGRTIHAVAVAGAVAVNDTAVTVVGAVTINAIDFDTDAHISRGADVTAGGALSVTAVDRSRITVDAGGVAIALAKVSKDEDNGGGATVGVSVGASVAVNDIANTIQAYVDAAAVTSQGALELTAVSDSTIDALTIGAAAAVGASKQGSSYAFSGAGAFSFNDIDNTVEARITTTDQVQSTQGGLSLTAVDQSRITADGGGVALAVAKSSQGKGGGISVGASIAENTITNDIRAKIDNTFLADPAGSSVTAAGDIRLSALSASTIDALTIGGAAAVGYSSQGAGFAGAIAGASSTNTITNTIEAFVKGAGTVTSTQGGLFLSAIDSAAIIAQGVGGAVAVGAGTSSTGIAISVGIGLGDNEINNTVQAYLSDAGVSTQGDISLQALSVGTINAFSLAASVSVGGGKKTGIALSGGGADSRNVLLSRTKAYAVNSQLVSGGDVHLQAVDTAVITAKVWAVSASVGFGKDAGVGAAIGASIARNLIGYDLDGNWKPAEVLAYLQNSSVQAAGDLTQQANAAETINATVMAGAVAIAASKDVSLGLAGSGVDTRNKISTRVKAYIDGSGDDGISAAAIRLSAGDTAIITADAGSAALSVSVAGEKAAISLSIGVTLADNIIANEIAAYITNADAVKAMGGDVRLETLENATVNAVAVAASMAVGISPKGFSLSLSGAGADATNTIANQVKSYITHSSVETTATPAGFADHTSSDQVLTLRRGDRVELPQGAGIYEYIGPDIQTPVDLSLQNYADTTLWRSFGPDIVLDARSTSTIDALVGAASLSVSIGKTAAAAAIGVSLAENRVGAIGGIPLLNQVMAYADDADLISAGDIQVHAANTETIEAVSFSGAVAIAAGSGALSLAGTGAQLTNTLSTKVHAYLWNTDATAIGDVDIRAISASDIIESGAVGVAVALSLAPKGAAVSVAVSLVDNDIINDVQAYIGGTTAHTVKAGGNINIVADVAKARVSDAYATTVSVSAGFIAASGGGIDIQNTINNNVLASVVGPMTLAADGDIQILAHEDAYINGDAVAVTAAIGLGGAIGVALVTNEINSSIQAAAIGATVFSANTVIFADSRADIANTKTGGISGGIATAAANRADADIATLVQAYAQNAVLMSTEDVSIKASAVNINKGYAWGAAIGGVAVGAMISDVTLGRGDGVDEVVAEVGAGTTVSARTLRITAVSGDDLLAESIAGGGGVVAAAGAESKVTSDQAAVARLETGAQISANTLMVNAFHGQTVDAGADSFSIAAAAGSGAGVDNLITSKARVDIGAATVTAGNIVITAKNELHKEHFYNGANLRSGSASLGNVTVLKSETEIGTDANPFEAAVNIGAGAHLTVAGDQQNPGTFRVEALNDITAVDSVRIESVSGFGVSVGISRLDSHSNAAVNLDGAVLESNAGDIYLTAKTDASLNPSANLLVASALTGATGAEAHAETYANNNVHINASTVKGSDIYLYAGRDSFGVPNLLDSFANTEITTISWLPSINVPVPDADIYENNIVHVTGTPTAMSEIRALEDVSLIADEGLGGNSRATTEGMVMSLSVPPYGFPVPDNGTVSSTNWVIIDPDARIEAGINNQTIVHILPQTLNGVEQLDPARIGTPLTAQEQADLGFPADIQYEYAALNLDQIAMNISPGDVVYDVATGQYYRYTPAFDYTSQDTPAKLRQGDRVKVGVGAIGANRGDVYSYVGPNLSVAVNLAVQDYSNGKLWVQVTGPSVDLVLQDQDYTDTAVWEQLLPGEINDDLAFIRSDAAQSLQDNLEGKFYVLKPSSLDDVTLSLKNVGAMLLEQRETILSWMTNHADDTEAVARYTVQLAQLDATLADLGLFETVTLEDGQTVTVVNKDLDALFVQLPDIYAAPGSIFIEADIVNQASLAGLVGTQLNARAGATIQMVNATPFSLVVNDAVIRDNRKVTVKDGVYTVLAPGYVYFNDTIVPGQITGDDTAVKEISITQPDIPTDAYDLGDMTLPPLDQDIYISGDVINEVGNLTIVNQEASIHVTGEIRADHVDIQAAKDFNLTSDSWFHSNRDPRQYIDYDTYRALSKTSANPFVYPTTDNVIGLTAAIDDDQSAVVAQGNIAVTARYLNIDGLIQSGAQTIALHIDADFDPGRTTSLLGDNGKPIDGVDFGGEGVPLEAYFDADKQAIVVEDIVPKGGSIVLAGQIFSTGNGRVKVAHGYADVDIDNDSTFALIVNRIDTTTDREGTITIVDTALLKKTVYTVSENQIIETIYQGTPGAQVSEGDGFISAIAYEPIPDQPDPYALDDTILYHPQTGLRYLWTEGQELTKVVVTKYEKKSFNLFGFDWDDLVKDTSYVWRTINYRDQYPLLESEVLVIDAIPANADELGVTYIESPDYAKGQAYTIDYELKADLDVDLVPGDIVKVVAGHSAGGTVGNRYAYVGEGAELVLAAQNYTNTDLWDDVTLTTTDAEVTYHSDYANASVSEQKWTSGGGWLRKKTVHRKITEITGQKDFYTHSLKADYPIGIGFLQGSDTPTVSINSGGDLHLQGDIDVPEGGAINLGSDQGSVISAEASAVFVVSPTITAGDGVRLNVEGDQGPLMISAGGDIVVNAVTNPTSDDPNSRLVVGTVESTGGRVFLNGVDGILAADADAVIRSESVELLSVNAGIGTAALPIRIDSDVVGDGGLAARAVDDIYIREIAGDLKLIQPQSWADAEASVHSLTGDVFLTAETGSILDAWHESFAPPSDADVTRRDTTQSLTGDAAEAVAANNIRLEESSRTQTYHDYWETYRDARIDTVQAELSIESVDADTDEVHFSQAHGLNTGDQIYFSVGLDLTAEDYTDTNRWLEISVPDANSQPDYDLTDPEADTRVLLLNGQLVRTADGTLYSYQDESADPLQTNLQTHFVYYAVVVDETTIQLAASRQDAAIAETPVTLDLQVDAAGDASLTNFLIYNYQTSAYDPDQVVDEKYQAVQDAFGAGAYDPDYIYHMPEAEREARLSDRTFTQDQLRYPISQDLFSYLYPDDPGAITPNTDTTEMPNVIGHRVVLTALDPGGQVGRVSDVVFIDLSRGYDPVPTDQKEILSLATIEDILDVQRDGDGQVTGLTLQVWNDINVQADVSLTVDAGDGAAIQTDGELLIDHVRAGGDVRLQAGGAVTDLGTDPHAAVQTGGDLTILAIDPAAGHIGAADNRLRIDLTDPATFSARAGVDIFVVDTADLYLGRVTAPHIDLLAQGSMFDGNNDTQGNLFAGDSLILRAVDGGIGTSDNDVDMDSLAAPEWTHDWILDAAARQSIYLAESDGPLVIGDNMRVISAEGDVGMTATDRAETGNDLTVNGTLDHVLYSPTGSVLLRAGDDLILETGGIIEAQKKVILYGDFGNADAGLGSDITILSPLTAASVEVYGDTDADHMDISHMTYTTVGPAPLWTLDGREGGDQYTVNLTGMGKAEIQVADSGLTGTDALILNGTAADDTFLFRQDFVALLRPDGKDGQGKVKYAPDFERVRYDAAADHLTVNSGEGDDHLAMDDNGVETTLNTGGGDDVIQIGQVFRSAPDGVETLETTVGYLSNGVSFTTTVNAGDGNDSLSVYRNRAELFLNGQAGDDQFLVRAFAEATTNISGDEGADVIQYAVNAPVNINGGDGLDKLLLIGTEKADALVITGQGVYGAGLHTEYTEVEYVTVDGYIGDDTFFVLSTNALVSITIMGSYGNDTIHVGGTPEGTDLNAIIVTDVPVDYDPTFTLTPITGPLRIEGGYGAGDGGRPLGDPVNMPGQGEADASYGTDERIAGLDESLSQDRLFVYDTADTADSRALLTDTSLTGLGMSQGAVIGDTTFPAGIVYKDLEAMTIDLGSGNDRFDVHSTHAGTTRVLGRDGDDTFDVGSLAPELQGGIVDAVAGELTFAGNAGVNILNVDDTGDAKDNLGTLTGSSLTGLGMAKGIRYFDMANLNIGLGSGNDIFNVQGTTARTDIQGNAGNEIFNISSDSRNPENGTLDYLLGELAIHGGAGSHTLNISDYGDPDADGAVVITRSTVTGLAPVRITYDSTGWFGGGVNIRTGRGSDGVTIAATLASSVTSVWLNGGDDTAAISDDGSGADGLLILFGEDGNDRLVVTDPAAWTAPVILFGDYGTVEFGPGFIPVYSQGGLPERSAVQLAQAAPLGTQGSAGRLPEKSVANLQSAYTLDPARGGNDVLTGGAADDVLIGGAGNDTLTGNTGDDVLIGDGGRVTFLDGRIRTAETFGLFTGGSDLLIGGPGHDIMLGGAGHDYFQGDLNEDIMIGDYGRVTLDSQGTAQSAVRLGQGNLDLIAGTQFGLYTPMPLAFRREYADIRRPLAVKHAAVTGGEAVTTSLTSAESASHHGGERIAPKPTPEPYSPPEFREAFSAARQSGLGKDDVFEWNGKRYRAALAEEEKNVPPPAPGSFAEAFANARKEGKRKGDTFVWRGKTYDAGIVGETGKEEKGAQPDRADSRIPDGLGIAAAGFMGWRLASPEEKKNKKRIDPEAFAALDKRMNARRFREWR